MRQGTLFDAGPVKKAEPEKEKRFRAPTAKEVQEYCESRSNHVDAESFVDFYTSKGWMVGRNKMTDWKAAVRTWERRNVSREQTRESEQIGTISGWAAHRALPAQRICEGDGSPDRLEAHGGSNRAANDRVA